MPAWDMAWICLKLATERWAPSALTPLGAAVSAKRSAIRPRAPPRSGVFEPFKPSAVHPLRDPFGRDRNVSAATASPPVQCARAPFSLSFCSLFAFFIFVPFFIPFYLPKVAPDLQNPSQKLPKTVPKTLQKSIQKIASFLNRFLTIFPLFLVQKIKSKAFKNQWENVLLKKAEHPRNTIKYNTKTTFL